MNIKGKGQRLIPEELLKYLEALKNKYPDAVDLVEANPTLEGGEDSLSSVLINGTKYAVGGGGKLYQHKIVLYYSTPYMYESSFVFVTNKNSYASLDEMFKDILGNQNYNWYSIILTSADVNWKILFAIIVEISGDYRVQYCPNFATEDKCSTVATISNFNDIVTEV